MLRQINYQRHKESLESQRAARRYHPATVIKARLGNKQVECTIGAGDSDRLRVFKEGDQLIVFNKNAGLDYAGLEVFDATGKRGEVFFQTDYDIRETFGRNGLDRPDRTLVKIMLQYID